MAKKLSRLRTVRPSSPAAIQSAHRHFSKVEESQNAYLEYSTYGCYNSGCWNSPELLVLRGYLS